MAAIFIRTLVIYAGLCALMRFSGKRQIGQMQVSELVTTFLLSNLASAPLSGADIPVLYAAVPILTLICLEVLFSFLTTKVTFIKKLLDGKPSIIINKGQIDVNQMSKMRLTLEDLLCELRIAGYSSASEIDYAILESNGKLSFFPSQQSSQICGIAHPVIIDGVFVKYALADSGKSEKWVLDTLKKKKTPLSSVFLMTVDDSDKVEIIEKEECAV
ncbi:MAG: DUF421 domain-containing protein [Clostridia bacterium]|nr:DUF421 domain-containing protein [Clostridia bacterium]